MNRKKVVIIGVPLDLGAGRRGVDMGPNAMRVAGLHERIKQIGCREEDWGDISIPNPPKRKQVNPKIKYLKEVTAACERLGKKTLKAMREGALPISLGGDHSLAIGSIAGISAYFRDRDEKLGLIWVDAHTDMNTEKTSPSGNIHGMPLSAVLGHGHPKLTELFGFSPKVAPENAALIGIRSVDEGEREVVQESGVRVFTMREIDSRGLGAVMKDAIAIASNGTAGIHLSYDVDACSPEVAPGVGTPVQGGLTFRESHLVAEMVAESGLLTSMDIVEINTAFDIKNQTAKLGVDLIASALGQAIL